MSIARLATACFLADMGLAEWLKLPPSAQQRFAVGQGIGPEDLVRANHVLGTYLQSELEGTRRHRAGMLDAIFDPPRALSQEAP